VTKRPIAGFIVVAVALSVGLLGLPSQASGTSIVSQLFPNSVNHLEDNDWEFLAKGSGASLGPNIVEVGDFLVGMFQIQKLNDTASAGTFTPTQGSDTTFSAVFALRVASIDPHPIFGALLQVFTMAAPTDPEWVALADAYGLPSRTSSGTLALIYEDSSNPFVDPAAGSKTAALATATDGAFLWEVGFTGALGEFWSAVVPTTDITAIIGHDLAAFANFGAGVNVTHSALGAPTLGLHNFLNFPTSHQIQLKGTFEPLTGNAGNNFQAQTDTDVYIRPVPAPATLLLLGAGLSALGSLGYLSRRRKAGQTP
jgi:hypothetical protein